MKSGRKERLIGRVLLCGLLLTILSRYQAFRELREWPKPEEIQVQSLRQPVQTDTDAEPFILDYRGSEYMINPVQNYELSGVIVSHNNIHSWFDMYNDKNSENFKDLCVVWGQNVSTGVFQRVNYSSGPWTCFYRPKTREAGELFSHDKLSNNHILSNRSDIREAVMNAGVGDQIHLKGMLINYSPRAHPSRSRNSSLVRTDTGNGACEVVFVKEFEVTKAHKPFWRKVDRVSRSMFWIFLILIPLTRFMSGILRYQQQKKALEFALERKRRRKEALSRMGSRQSETVSEP